MLMDHRATQNWKCHSNLDRLIMAVWGADPDPCWHWGHFLLSRVANFTSGKKWCFKATLLHHAAWYIPRVLFWGAPLCVKIRQVSRWHLNSRLDINGNKPHWHRVCVFSEKEKEFHINIACAWSGLQVLLCRLLLSSTATFFYSNPALVWGLCGSSSISLRFCVVHSDCWRHWSIFLNNIDSDNDNLCSVHRKKNLCLCFLNLIPPPRLVPRVVNTADFDVIQTDPTPPHLFSNSLTFCLQTNLHEMSREGRGGNPSPPCLVMSGLQHVTFYTTAKTHPPSLLHHHHSLLLVPP